MVALDGGLGKRRRRLAQAAPPGTRRLCGRRRAEQGLGEALAHAAVGALAESGVGLPDRVHVRLDIGIPDVLGDPAEVPAKILFLGAFGDRDIGGHANDDLVQHQPFRPENRQFLFREPGQARKFPDFAGRAENALGAEDRFQRPEALGDSGADTRIPGGKFSAALSLAIHKKTVSGHAREAWSGRPVKPCRRASQIPRYVPGLRYFTGSDRWRPPCGSFSRSAA